MGKEKLVGVGNYALKTMGITEKARKKQERKARRSEDETD